MRAARAFVLDVRGNEGGGDGSVREFFKRLTTGPLRGREIERVESEVTVQGTVNDLTCALEGESRPASREIMSRDRAAAQASLTGPPERKIVKLVPLVAEGVAPHPYSGALVVLVDSRCASSCEAFVRYARQLPGAVVVGENTAGAGVFGETHSYPLPSGLWMTAGSKHFHDPDPLRDVVEGRGHLPDLWLDSDNAAGLAESLARCLGTPACAARLDEKRAAVP